MTHRATAGGVLRVIQPALSEECGIMAGPVGVKPCRLELPKPGIASGGGSPAVALGGLGRLVSSQRAPL